MAWQMALGLGLAVPFILLPVVFVWWLNMGGALAAVRRAIGHGAPAQDRNQA